MLLSWLSFTLSVTFFYRYAGCHDTERRGALFKTLLYFRAIGVSSNVASDTIVTLTNFVKNFNLSGRLYFDSLMA